MTAFVTGMKGIFTFILIAFGLAWLPWQIVLVFEPDPGPQLFGIVSIPVGFSPAIAAFIVRKWVTREGFADVGLKPNLTRWRYYLIGWLLPLLVVVFIVLLSTVLGIGEPYFNVGILPNFAMQLTIFAFIGMFGALGAEFAWRGYLQLRLFANNPSPHQPILAAAATGIIWSCWYHVSRHLRDYDFPDQPILGMLVVTITFILHSIIFGWLRVKTGSIWAPSLAHAATNTVGGSYIYALFGGLWNDPNWILVSFVGMLAWIPMGTLCVWIVKTGQLKAEIANNDT